MANYNLVHCFCLEENAWQGNTLVFNQKRTKCKTIPFCVGTGPQAIFVFIFIIFFIIALTLLRSEGQMVCDCLVALHVSMFG